ncbi:hypothetical protein GF340_00095 [Candidatus Peregrinibacteria bacterium]|nr:hypothetical protein [Candidatus Peregrinibacteria bacterium]
MNVPKFLQKSDENKKVSFEKMVEQEEAEFNSKPPKDEDKVTAGTKIKVIAAVAVVGFASYIAFWVQQPAEIQSDVLNDDVNSTEVTEELENDIIPAEATVAQSDGVSFEEVSIVDFAFSPANITLEPDTTVIWTNMDSVDHTVTSDFFTSETLAPGDSYSYTFETQGVYEYSSSFYPQMTGKITVESADAEAMEETVDPEDLQPAAPEVDDEPAVPETETAPETETDSEAMEPVDEPVADEPGLDDLATSDDDAVDALIQDLLENNEEVEVIDADGEADVQILENTQADSAEDAVNIDDVLSEDELRGAAEGEITESGPEHVLYAFIIGLILYVNRKKLFRNRA